MGSLNYRHTTELFNGTEHHIIKSHCFLCHRQMTPNKKVRGNACYVCDQRAKRVSKYSITEEQSDFELSIYSQDLEMETWNIDGEDYYKYPNGKLCKK